LLLVRDDAHGDHRVIAQNSGVQLASRELFRDAPDRRSGGEGFVGHDDQDDVTGCGRPLRYNPVTAQVFGQIAVEPGRIRASALASMADKDTRHGKPREDYLRSAKRAHGPPRRRSPSTTSLLR
jgi:hypothetical protein